MWILKTTCSGESHPLSTVYKDHYNLSSALHGLPFPSMASLDHSGSKTIMSTVWQSTQIDMSWCFVSSGQHLVDEKRSSGFASGSSIATPHSWKKSVAWLNQRFSDRLISCKCDQQWSLYSSDLNPPYFHLWRYFKDWVYVHDP